MNIRRTWILWAGLLALAAPAPADVVWSGERNLTVSPDQLIDLNDDTKVDVWINYATHGDTSVKDSYLLAYIDSPLQHFSNRILVSLSSPYDALPSGTLINGAPDPLYEWAGGTFFAGNVSSWVVFSPGNPQIPPSESSTEWEGPLGDNGNAYIGIEFDVGGTNHYGWVNIALGEEGYMGFRDPVITSWAYESTPNTAIAAGAIPEPSTGILTVVGSISLLWLARSRRRTLRRGSWR